VDKGEEEEKNEGPEGEPDPAVVPLPPYADQKFETETHVLAGDKS
jgi:hypothetical protein